MFGNQWHKKERPLFSLLGLGGAGGIMQSGIADSAISASGGTETTTPNHTIHRLNSSNPFVVSKGGQMQIVVIAGGGGGGGRHGGGGGGGGILVLPQSNGTIPAGTYTCTVGAGGAQALGGQAGNPGSDSSFGPPSGASAPTHILAKGGGRGGSYPSPSSGTGGPGGCGGGGSGEQPPGS